MILKINIFKLDKNCALKVLMVISTYRANFSSPLAIKLNFPQIKVQVYQK